MTIDFFVFARWLCKHRVGSSAYVTWRLTLQPDHVMCGMSQS